MRRERNKLAAAKCRNRRKELTDFLQAVSWPMLRAPRLPTPLSSPGILVAPHPGQDRRGSPPGKKLSKMFPSQPGYSRAEHQPDQQSPSFRATPGLMGAVPLLSQGLMGLAVQPCWGNPTPKEMPSLL